MRKEKLGKIAHYISITLLFVALAFTFIGCSVSTRTNHRHQHNSNVPPGQAKKYYGERSAKRYAPGQQKNKEHSSSHKDNGRKKSHSKRDR